MTFMLTHLRHTMVIAMVLLVIIPLHGTAQTPVAPAPDGDVPMFRADAARSGAMPGPGLTGQPSLLWRYESLTEFYGAPAIVDGVAYFGDGFFGGGGLRAIDVATGQELWTAELLGQPFSLAPAVVGGMAFIGDLDGNVTAVDTATGEVAWSVLLGGDITSPAAVVDGTVFIRNGEDVLYALDAATGDERWQYATGGEGGYTLDTAPAVVDGVVYMTTIDSDREDSLFALDAESGEELWTFAPSEPGLFTPAVVDGVVYAAGDGGIYAVDAASGDQIWNAPVGIGFSAPAVADGTVVVHTRRDVVAVEAATGELLWRYDTGGSWSAPTVVDGVVYVGSSGVAARMGLHMIDLASGERVWHVQAVNSMNGSPVVIGGVVYAGGKDGLFALGSSDSDVAPDDERVITTLVSQPIPALDVDEGGNPVEPGDRFPTGTDRLTVIFDYFGVPEGSSYHIAWHVDGVLIHEASTPWPRWPDGRTNYGVSANEGALPDGMYEIVISIDGQEVRQVTATIGG